MAWFRPCCPVAAKRNTRRGTVKLKMSSAYEQFARFFPWTEFRLQVTSPAMVSSVFHHASPMYSTFLFGTKAMEILNSVRLPECSSEAR